MSSDSLSTVIDGETFAGKSVMRGGSTTVGTLFGTGNAYGTSTVIGNKGSTLSCQLNYADLSGYTPLGGNGVCNHSDGRIIDVVW